MKFLNIIMLIFMTLKLLNKIDWSWWLVLSPTILSCSIWLVIHFWWESKTPLEKAQYLFRTRNGL